LAAHRLLTRQNDDRAVSTPTETLRVAIADDHHLLRLAVDQRRRSLRVIRGSVA
jgi:hypothetical protein